MKTRWKILIILLVVAVLSSGLSLMTMRVGPENNLEAYKNSLRAQGEKLEIKEVAPTPALREENGRSDAETAFSSLGSGLSHIPRSMWMIAPGKAITVWSQPQACGVDFTNSWEDFAADVAVYSPAIEALRRAAERPKLDFGLDYEKGPTLRLPHLAAFKRSAQVLCAASTLGLHNGDTAQATTNLCVLLHLIKANEDESIIISHLVRIAMCAICLGGTWDLLQATNVSDSQLAALQNSWAGLEFVQPLENAMLMERAMNTVTFEHARSSSSYLGSVTGGLGPSGGSGSAGDPLDRLKQGLGTALWRASWSYSQELDSFRGDQIILTTLRTMQTNQCWKTNYDVMQAQLSRIQFTYPGQALFQKLEIPDFSDFFNNGYAGGTLLKTIRIEAARRIVITAIALKRYQLRHGHLPDVLTDLTPDFLSAVPLDPIDGNPLRYHKNEDGTYLLYSIGDDGVDNGGDPTIDTTGKPAYFYWQSPHSRDWVWPQPATPAEIKYFQEHP